MNHFGGRWGILWRRLEVPLCRVKAILKCCMVLHNLCVDAGCNNYSPSASTEHSTSTPDGVRRVVLEEQQYVDEVVGPSYTRALALV